MTDRTRPRPGPHRPRPARSRGGSRVARPLRLAAALAAGALLAAGCGGAGGSDGPFADGGGSSGRSIDVLMVNNPQMVDIQSLTADGFTKETGIAVNYTVLPENDIRNKATQEIANQAGQYDVATISNYEVPFFSRNGWLEPLDAYAAADPDFDQADIIPTAQQSLTGADGKVYAEPFYGESSFLMYRKDVFAAEGVTMPANPTWQQVADIAAEVDNAQPGMRGICLRGLTGWGQVFAPLTTVVNTFGGTWFTEDYTPQVDAAPFKRATQFYVDLVRAHGEPGAATAGFTECLNAMTQSQVAMWYDATSAAGSLEAEGSPVAGKLGYAAAPVAETKSSGWLYNWAWAIEKTSQRKQDAWEFVSWASGKDYERLVGEQLGWARVPAGKRTSTYAIPEYTKAAAPFYRQTYDAILKADPTNPGVQKRPAPGIQFVAIPEFADIGTRVSLGVSSAIAGQITVDEALERGQKIATDATERYREDGS